ncbi:MAG: hypothetical protein JWQ96_264 [Segetibacter sp.]|nr:hypothetical protein [Segetibacter sp.]
MTKNRVRIYVLVAITLVCGTVQEANGQKNLDVAFGIGIQEMTHVAARYQIDQFKFGISVGSFPDTDVQSITFSADAYYHFGGKSKRTTIRPWFARSGVIFIKSEGDLSTINHSWIYLRAGRDFNFSKTVGIALDAGMSKRINYKEEFKRSYSSWNLFNFKEWPSGAIQLYFRL